jgi:hypothetical protein
MGKASRTPRKGRRGEFEPGKRASADQIVQLLDQRPTEIYEALGLEPSNANISFPTDGRGARIRASIRPGVSRPVPSRIMLAIDDEHLEVPVEVDTDFQEFQPLAAYPSGASRPRRATRG